MIICEDSINLQHLFLFTSCIGISSVFNLCYFANHQLFRHEIKGQCASITASFGRFGAVFAPMTVELEPPLPLVIFTVSCAVGFLIVLFGLKQNESAYGHKK